MSQRSLLWQYFKKNANSASSGSGILSACAVCKLCGKSVHGRNTTNLKAHLKNRHPSKYYELEKTKYHQTNDYQDQEDMDENSQLESFASSGEIVMSCTESSETNDSSVQRTQNSENAPGPSTSSPSLLLWKRTYHQPTLDTIDRRQSEKIDRAVTYCVAVDSFPYNIVEREGFKHLVQTLKPAYKLPSRKKLTESLVPKLYLETKERVKSALSKCNFVSFTTDVWTSVANEAYLSLTVHFIEDWKMKKACLNCIQVSSDQTAINLAEILEDLIADWGITENNRVSITTDCGSNIVKAVQVEMKGITDIEHITCFGHTMNTAVAQAFELSKIKDILDKIKEMHNLCAHSVKVNRELRNLQEHYNLPLHKIPSYCKTRWWSLFKLITVVVEQNVALMSLLQQYQKGKYKHLILDQLQLDVLQDIIAVLKPIETVSTNMSGEFHVTSSCILPLYYKLESILSSAIDIEETCIDYTSIELKHHFMEKNLDYMSKRYVQKAAKNSFLKKCSFVDPRFKLKYFKVEERDEIIASISREMESTGESEEFGTHISKRQNSNSSGGLSAIFSINSPENKNMQPQNEIQQYLNLDIIYVDDDPMSSWQLNKSKFPKLSLLAQKYLCSQGTSVPSEREFSRAGRIVSDQRSSLTGEHAEQLIFLASNKDYVYKFY